MTQARPTHPSDDQLLHVEDVEVSYGAIRALNGVTLSLAKGELVAILGVNGAGKTTLLNTISGILRPDRGDLRFQGVDINGMAPAKLVERGVALSPEGRRVFPEMTVSENLELGAFLERNRRTIDERRATVLDHFPILGDRSNQKAGTLSGGEQQMLAIGRALMSGPTLLLLDEPTLGLAPAIVNRVGEIIRAIREVGVSILLVEQNARVALALADRGYVLDGGLVVLEGSAEKLRSEEYVRRVYLADAAG